MGVSGESLGLLETLLGGLWTQKLVKTKCFLRVLKRLFFGSLQLLMALLGSSWSVLGGFGSRMASKMVPKSFLKCFKSLSKNDPKKGQVRVPQGVPESCFSEIAGLRHFLPEIRFCLSIILMFFFRFWSSLGASWEPSWAS